MRQTLDAFTESMILDNTPAAIPDTIKPIGAMIEEESKRMLDDAMKSEPIKIQKEPDTIQKEPEIIQDETIETHEDNVYNEEREDN